MAPSSLTPEIQTYVSTQLSDLMSKVQEKDSQLADLQAQLDALKVQAKKEKPTRHPRTSAPQQVQTSSRPSRRSAQPSNPTCPPIKSTRGPSKPGKPSDSKHASTSMRPSSKSTPAQATPKVKSKAKSPPSKRQHPLQMKDSDTPADYKPVKEAFYLVIKLLWGLVEQGAVPEAPDPDTLEEFYQQFTSDSDIRQTIDNSAALALVAQEEIKTLAGAKLGEVRVGRGMLRLKEVHIMCIHATLAKLGLRAWGPNLDEAMDSLLNSACRMSAIEAFRQVASAAAFDNTNLNLAYLKNIPLLIRSYNHYVHYVVAIRYRAEQKSKGKFKRDSERKNNQKNRERIKKERVLFAMKNGLPERYVKILNSIAAHSDDEFSEEHGFYVVKTLHYRSKNATKFFRRLDQEMHKAEVATGHESQRRTRRVPREPVPSTFTRPPTKLPLDFYNPVFFDSLSEFDQLDAVNTKQVAFLPKAEKSLYPKPYADPHEKLSETKFNRIFYDIISSDYRIKANEQSSESDSPQVQQADEAGYVTSDYGGSIDLEATSDGEDDDGDDGFYAEGEFDFISSDENGIGGDDDEDDDPEDEEYHPHQHQPMEGLSEQGDPSAHEEEL